MNIFAAFIPLIIGFSARISLISTQSDHQTLRSSEHLSRRQKNITGLFCRKAKGVVQQEAEPRRRASSAPHAPLRTPHQQHLWVKPSKQLLWSPCHRREGSDLLVPRHSPLISVTRRLSWRLTGRSRRSHLKDWPVAAGFYFKIFTASGCSWRQELLMTVMILRRLSTLLINISH